MGVITTSVCLPKKLLEIIDGIKEARGDPTRSDTVRALLMQALAVLSYLSEDSKKAIGALKESEVIPYEWGKGSPAKE